MIEYRKNYHLEPTEVARVFDASGITRPIHDVGRIGRMFENSNLIISAWTESKLIGICRALTDFSYCCYLSDLAVDKAYQKKGIGREMIRHVQEAIGEEVSLILLSAPNAMSYYPDVGFEKIENGFIIKRKL
jgi:ribosomal protein S18 acetylase RimI-like enzyme